MKTVRIGWTVLFTLGTLIAIPSSAEGQRDPTQPPYWGPVTDAPLSTGRGTRAPMSIISVDGKLHLMVGTRLYAKGQKVGDSIIERIGETEVLFREGSTLRTVSNFVGVKRSVSTDMTVAPVR